MSQFTEAACWMALLEAGDLPRTAAKRAIQQWCLEDARTMREFLDLGLDDLSEHLDIRRPVISLMLAQRPQVALWEQRIESLAQQGIRPLLRHEAPYPDLLAERLSPTQQPYYFWYRGSPALLAEPGLLVVGARSPSPAAAAFAHRLGAGAGEMGACSVGGYEEGIQRTIQEATLSNDGSAIIVLPLGIDHFAKALQRMASLLETGKLLVMSPYAPDAALSSLRAQARQSITAALAGVCLAIEPEAAPNDWPGHAVLTAGHVPRYAWNQDRQETAQAWIQAGATAIDDLESALAQVATWLAPDQDAAVTEAIPLDEAEAYGIEPIRFKDADDAIERLSESGQVPERLRRRLHDTEWEDEP